LPWHGVSCLLLKPKSTEPVLFYSVYSWFHYKHKCLIGSRSFLLTDAVFYAIKKWEEPQMKKNKAVSKKKKSLRDQSLRDQYCEIVKSPYLFINEEESLQQPHIHKFIDSVATYGAYEKPI
jgi:hypothetical protein